MFSVSNIIENYGINPSSFRRKLSRVESNGASSSGSPTRHAVSKSHRILYYKKNTAATGYCIPGKTLYVLLFGVIPAQFSLIQFKCCI